MALEPIVFITRSEHDSPIPFPITSSKREGKKVDDR